MPEPILDPKYWRDRLHSALGGSTHHAIFRCPLDRWERIARKHREILSHRIEREANILDVGCGWGRLLELLPDRWRGNYLGVDLCPEFIEIGKVQHGHRPNVHFLYAEAGCVAYHNPPWVSEEGVVMAEGYIPPRKPPYDWAVMISFRPMIIRNLGGEYWDRLEQIIMSVSDHQLYLEYDENDLGSIVF